MRETDSGKIRPIAVERIAGFLAFTPFFFWIPILDRECYSNSLPDFLHWICHMATDVE